MAVLSVHAYQNRDNAMRHAWFFGLLNAKFAQSIDLLSKLFSHLAYVF